MLHYVRVAETSFKVSISESDVQSAISAGAKSGCFVARWCDRNNRHRRSGCNSAHVHPSDLYVDSKSKTTGVIYFLLELPWFILKHTLPEYSSGHQRRLLSDE